MPRLPELRLDQRLQLMMPTDLNVVARMAVDEAHGMSGAPGLTRDKERPTALSLAETVELLVHGRCTRRGAEAADTSKVA
jgi:hypothetical protein